MRENVRDGLNPEQARRIVEECYGEVLAYCRRHAPTGHEPADLREVVETRYGAGLGVGEVAYTLGISRFSVRRRINAALKLLEKELREGDLDG